MSASSERDGKKRRGALVVELPQENTLPTGQTPAIEPLVTASGDDPLMGKIVDALEQIRADEFDYEILRAASEVLGEDVSKTWKPSLSYLPPEKQGAEYHVTVYAKGACETCPIKQSHVGSIEPKLRSLVGYDEIYVHDYYDMFDWGRRPQLGDA